MLVIICRNKRQIKKKGEARFKISEVLTTDKKLLPNFDEDRHCPKAFVTRELKQTDQVYSGK